MTNTQRPMSVGQAVAIGHLMLTLPMLFICCMAVGLLVLISQDWRIGIVGALVGIAAAGVWWALITPRWRRWALGRGVPPDQLQKWAMMTGLVLPGSRVAVSRPTPLTYSSAPDTQSSEYVSDNEVQESPDE